VNGVGTTRRLVQLARRFLKESMGRIDGAWRFKLFEDARKITKAIALELFRRASCLIRN